MTPPALRSRRPRRTRRLIGCIAVSVLLAVIGTPGAAAFLTTYALLYAPCGEHATTPGDFGYTWEDVRVPARGGGEFRAYFIPGSNGAAIIIPPAMASGRGNRLHEADVLARHGYAVLTLESRRCADMGPLSLGYNEADDIGDAVAYLSARDDVDASRIGVLGFSSAGAAAIMAAARYPAIHAVVAEGGYGDFAEGVIGIRADGDHFLEKIYKHALRISYYGLTKITLDQLSPLTVIGDIRPRPILLIYGSTERSLEGARDQLAAAGDNAQLWVVEGAGHGNYLATAPEEYEMRVITFFDRALQGSR